LKISPAELMLNRVPMTIGMNERAFAILRIMEQHAAQVEHITLQAAAIAIDGVYAEAHRSQPSWVFMDGYKKEFRKQVRKALNEHELPETKSFVTKRQNTA
jgi:type I restriction enzyme, R subunit